jgi:hypothetical protein
MGLKAILEALDDVPEGVREVYKNVDGKFVLDIEGIDQHPAVANLKSAHERQKAATAEAKAAAAEARARLEGLPDDFTPETFAELRAKAEAAGNVKPDEQIAKVRETLEKKHAAELAKYKADLEKERGIATKLLVDDGLTAALAAVRVKPELMDGAKAYLRGLVKVADEGGDRKAIVETDMGPMALQSYIAEWAGSEKGRAYLAPPSGGDARGSSSGGKGKTIPRAEFDKMDHRAQAQTVRSGVKVIED